MYNQSKNNITHKFVFFGCNENVLYESVYEKKI